MNQTPQKIKRIRKAAGLTQAQLAAQLGVTVQAVKNWEAGRRGVAARYDAELARIGGGPAAVSTRVNSRPKYADLDPGDWAAASKYGWCELKYDGEYCELRGGPDGYTITGRRGGVIATGSEPLPVCHLLMEHIVGTEWAHGSGPFGSYVVWGALSTKGVHLSREQLRGFYAALHFAGLLVVISERIPVTNAAGQWMYHVINGNWEGLIFRTAGGKFARMKKRVTVDYVMTGYENGSVIGALYNKRGKLIDKVRVPCPASAAGLPGDVFEASGLAITERGSLRNPRLDRWRENKLARECTT